MIATLFCSLAGGMLLVLSVSRIEATAYRWVRLIGVVAFAASVGVGVWSIMRGAMAGGGLGLAGGVTTLVTATMAAAVIVVAPIMNTKPAFLRAVSGAGGAFGIASCCMWSMARGDTTIAVSLLNVVGQMLGALLLGSVTVAWLLGHAYLTATAMTIAPLRRIAGLFALAVALRWAFLLICVGIAYFAELGGPAGGGLAATLAGAWLIVSLRVAVGLFAVSLFAYMVWDCVKLRSTQSATGILYFASVFVYIGELSSQHLAGELGIPL